MSSKVSCLMVTHGRHQHVCDALSCFLAQDYEERELLILNHHKVPLLFDHPKVRIFNEPNGFSYGHNLNRLLFFADGEFLRTWDDDDFHLPWAISQGVDNIEEAIAWKPARSWFYDGHRGTVELACNNFEPSVTWRTEFVRRHGYDEGHHEHDVLHHVAHIVRGEMYCWSPFLTTWGTGVIHYSGGMCYARTVEERAAIWREVNQDHGDGKPLEPADVSHWWYMLARGIPTEHRNEWLKRTKIHKAARSLFDLD